MRSMEAGFLVFENEDGRRESETVGADLKDGCRLRTWVASLRSFEGMRKQGPKYASEHV